MEYNIVCNPTYSALEVDLQQGERIVGEAGAMAWMSRENEVVMGQVILGQFWNICGIFCDGFE